MILQKKKKNHGLLENKYGLKSKTYVQLQLSKFNGCGMPKNDSVVDYIMKFEVHQKIFTMQAFLSLKKKKEKRQVSILLNGFPRTWNRVTTSLTQGQKELCTLPSFLALEEGRLNFRKRENRSNNLLLSKSSYNKITKSVSNRLKKEKHTAPWKFGRFHLEIYCSFEGKISKAKERQQKPQGSFFFYSF